MILIVNEFFQRDVFYIFIRLYLSRINLKTLWQRKQQRKK